MSTFQPPDLFRRCKLCRIVLPKPGEKHSSAVFETEWVPMHLARKGEGIIDEVGRAWTVLKVYRGTKTAEQIAREQSERDGRTG